MKPLSNVEKDPILSSEIKYNKLMSSFDANDWAKEFVELVKEKPTIATDEGTMLAWFASALMRGYDEHASRMRRVIDLTTKRGL